MAKKKTSGHPPGRGRSTSGSRRRRGAPGIEAAHEVLRGYADRGVFRGFSRAAVSGGRHEIRFRWLAGRDFRVRLDPQARRLVFVDLLPGVLPRSPMDRALRSFLRERSGAALPEHRRVDPQRLSLRVTNRDGSISLALALARRSGVREGEDWAYAARRGVSLVNEIFHGFLRGPYHEYMVRHFGEPEE